MPTPMERDVRATPAARERRCSRSVKCQISNLSQFGFMFVYGDLQSNLVL
jgi:hypothetical protein